MHRYAEGTTELILCGMVVFSPWAFGTTQPWAIWTMNIAGYALGALLLAKWLAVRMTGRPAARWNKGGERWPVLILGWVTVLLLAWCLVSAVNARATVNLTEPRLEYRPGYLPWLPHSYDAPSTWFAFWQYLGLAATFWAVRDWLRGNTRTEQARLEARGAALAEGQSSDREARWEIPGRLRRLLWLVCLNGSLVAAGGVLQRLDGTKELLWIQELAKPALPESHFGPFESRNSAAQFLNLVWPVGLGLWWVLKHAAPSRNGGLLSGFGGGHAVLVPLSLLTCGAAVFTGSRGGTAVAAGLCVVLALMLGAASARSGWRTVLVPAGLLLLAGGVALALGGRLALARFLAPQSTFPIAAGAPIADFTIRCIFDCPAEGAVAGREELFRLSSEPPVPGQNSVFVYLEQGSFVVRLEAAQTKNRVFMQRAAFTREYGGRRLEVMVTKQRDTLRLFAEGRELTFKQTITGEPPWDLPIAPMLIRYASLPSAGALPPQVGVRYIALHATALSPEQVGRTSRPSDGVSRGEKPGGQISSPLLQLGQAELEQPAPLRSQLSDRTGIHEIARVMVRDYGWWGSGPGTFGPLFQIYRVPSRAPWQWYAHNDWLELRITFGRIGFVLILLGLGALLAGALSCGGAPLPWVLAGAIMAAVLGCLVHARFDYPLQVHSISFSFLVWLAVVSCGTHRRPVHGC